MLSKLSFKYLINADPRIFYILSFLVPVIARGLPEIIMGKYIIGFDTISYYIPAALKWTNGGANLFEFMASAPLFYAILTGLTSAGVPLTISLKLLPSVLHGFLGVTIYLYARKSLEWSYWKSLLASFLATLYFVALRVSWDMLRNELGLIFLFIFFMFLCSGVWQKDSWKCYLTLMPSMILIVLTHQLVSIIMFAVLFTVILRKLLNRERAAVKNLVLSVLPAATLFVLTVYSEFTLSTSFSVVNGFQSTKSSAWLSLFGFASYFDMAAYNLAFLLYCYLPLLPLIVLGIRRFKNLELKAWLMLCLAIPFSSIFSPYAYRWTLILIFPAAFFVIEGFERFDSSRWKKILGGAMILLSSSFILLPAEVAFPYFGAFPSYVPSSMLQNSVPLHDCRDVETAMLWVRNNVRSDGILLVHDAFHGWALLFLDESQVVCYGYENPEEPASELLRKGRTQLFLVWWIPNEGWHGLVNLSSCFVEVFCSNRIAVYTYNTSSTV